MSFSPEIEELFQEPVATICHTNGHYIMFFKTQGVWFKNDDSRRLCPSTDPLMTSEQSIEVIVIENK